VTIEELAKLWESARGEFWTEHTGLDRAENFAGHLLAWIGDLPERFDTFEEHIRSDITGWLLDLVSHLTTANRVDDALAYCDRFAPFGNAEAFLGEQVTILSEAGRLEEAIAAAKALLERFPDHAWCHVFVADAFREVGDEVRAEAAYLRALELDATDLHTVEGVLERLMPWFEQLGRTDEAGRIAAQALSRLR
jgi:tetratricopeptide (TPR) repeat protein